MAVETASHGENVALAACRRVKKLQDHVINCTCATNVILYSNRAYFGLEYFIFEIFHV